MISFPGSPTTDFESQKADGNEYERGLIQVEERWTLGRYRRYRVVYRDRDDELVSEEALSQAVRQFVAAYDPSAHAIAVDSSEVEIDGYQGVQFTLYIGDVAVSRIRFYVVGGRIYELSVYGAVEGGDIHLQHFFSSFRILQVRGKIK